MLVPAVAPRRMRNTTEKAIVINAPMGFNQNDSCSKPTWRTTRPASLQPRKLPRTGTDADPEPDPIVAGPADIVTSGSETALTAPDLVSPR